MTDRSVSRRLASEPDFTLGALTVSPSTGRVFAGDQNVRIEALTMAVLVTLARADAATVTRDDLVAECWQGRIVSDDAVARAIAKVRALERWTTPAAFTLETVPKVGYRLLVASDAGHVAAARRWSFPSWATPARLAAGGAAVVVAAVLIGAAGQQPAPDGQTEFWDRELAGPVRSTDVMDALMNLDEERLRLYVRGGWNPNWKVDSEANTALHNLMMVCERYPSHDREGVVRVARLLVEAGADPTSPNKWNDTPLIIASARRYCGPDHPVVPYLKSEIAARDARRPVVAK